MVFFHVYCWIRIDSGKCYVGLSSKTPEVRRAQHIQRARLDSQTSFAFQEALKKYGLEAFTHEVLLDNLSKEQAQAAEKHFIKNYNSLAPGGYNLTTGGEATVFSAESRAKLSAARTGIKLSDSHRANLSKSHILLLASFGARVVDICSWTGVSSPTVCKFKQENGIR